MEPQATRRDCLPVTTKIATAVALRDPASHPLVKSTYIETGRQLCLRRGHPFEQSPMTYEQSKEGPYNRVGHQPRLMRKQGKLHRDLRQPGGEIGTDRVQMTTLGDPEAAWHDSGDEREHRS